LLLTQEFNFADTIHIWDTLLSDPDGPQVVTQTLVYSASLRSCVSLTELFYLPNTGNLAQNMLRNADPCPEAALGRRFHLEPQAPAELPPNKHQPPPVRREQAALKRALAAAWSAAVLACSEKTSTEPQSSSRLEPLFYVSL